MKTHDRTLLRRSAPGAVVAVAFAVALAALVGVATAARQAAPSNTSLPSITGTAQEGQKLVGSRGEWSGNPTDYNDTWQRCAKDGSSCANISGATDRTGYILKDVDVGNTIRLRVQATNADGSTAASSVPTAVVTEASKPAPPASNGCGKTGGTIPVASVSPPARLTIDQTQIQPSTVTFGTRSITARFHISACSGSVQGALVYVTAVPYGQFSLPNEQATDADGWATLQFEAVGYPVSSKQRLLVMFARARKSGENLLAGISTRRLVSFHVSRG